MFFFFSFFLVSVLARVNWSTVAKRLIALAAARLHIADAMRIVIFIGTLVLTFPLYRDFFSQGSLAKIL